MEISGKLPSENEYHVSNVDGVITGTEDSDSSDEKIIRGPVFKQHRKNFTESDSDRENVTLLPINNISKKPRMKINSDTDSDSELPTQEYSTTISKSSRLENKKIELHNKFKRLKNPHSQIPSDDSENENHSNISCNEDNDNFNEGISCLKIKKKIMKKKNALSSICDADTSDDDSIESSLKNIKKQRKTISKSLKPPPGTQPKMSTKQAMENMQKIKSESNRMLREKDVSLPYHKPRALSLQDIINRKKPTLTCDGKAMPIKMNSEQLVQYVKLLEERQKEMIELCKSESEEETLPENLEAQENSHVDHESDNKATNNEDNQDTDKSLSDKQFDDIAQVNLKVNTENNCVDDSARSDSPEKILSDNSQVNLKVNAKNNCVDDSARSDSPENILSDNSQVNLKVNAKNNCVDDSARSDSPEKILSDNSQVNLKVNAKNNCVDDSARSDSPENILSDNSQVNLKVNAKNNCVDDSARSDSPEKILSDNSQVNLKVNAKNNCVDDSARSDSPEKILSDNSQVNLKVNAKNNCVDDSARSDSPEKILSDNSQVNLKVNAKNNCVDDSARSSSPEKILIDNDNKRDSNEQIQNICSNLEDYQDYTNMDSEAVMLASNSEKTLNECNEPVEERGENCLINNNANDIVKTDKSNVSNEKNEISNDFSEDDEFNLQDIDKIIENAEIIEDAIDMKMSVEDQSAMKPKLTGTPGMFIDLESGDQLTKELTGVELLKERYTYFSKLKSLEDQEKNRNQKHKPGIQHLRLKHELEEQIAEQRSLEWEKRLEEEKQMKSEMNIEPGDQIEELESKLEKEEEEEVKESSSSDDEDLVEDDVEIKDKPRKSNPMVDEEAEESNEEDNNIEEENDDVEQTVDSADNDDSDNDSSDESSSESEDEKSKPRKGRILKAFEDSDDESNVDNLEEKTSPEVEDFKAAPAMNDENDMQDDEIQLAQMNRSTSEDIFATQGSSCVNETSAADIYAHSNDIPCTADLGSQTFSIMKVAAVNNNKKDEINCGENLSSTQPIDESRFDSFNKIRPGNLSQDLLMSQPLDSQSQEIGDDIAALCTGKFYDNPFVTQIQDDKINSQDPSINISNEQDELELEKPNNEIQQQDIDNVQNGEENKQDENHKDKKEEDCNILQSILDELNEPEIEKQNKFFVAKDKSDSQIKRRFIIDSDEENDEVSSKEKKSKLKKRKLERRALQISDDEEEEEDALDEAEVEESDIEDDAEKIVEYDSEENEIEVKTKKIKKRIGEFFENEAELTSEDEWAGSGDEDEAGPDRMEREEGDQDVFQQGRLQRELGQIHMREVLDQDKREVRLLQELLFEDGDLGDGHRQRKFRWKTDGEIEDEAGMGPINMTDTQEEEFESEELWRKQRHEREVFLRSMQENEEEELTNTPINRTALIKANLNASNVSKLNETKCTETETKVQEAKPTKDIPSPKKPFLILQQNYHGSLLSRGRGALARLAALATPLAEDAPRAPAGAPTNYVFATLSQPDPDAKVAKRKAETRIDTPRLLKKMKTHDTQKYTKNSLFDHFKT